MDFFRKQQTQWNSSNKVLWTPSKSPASSGSVSQRVGLRNELYTTFIDEFNDVLGTLEKQLLYHFLFSNPFSILNHSKLQMIQWMEHVRQAQIEEVNTSLELSEENLNYLVVDLNRFAHKLILFYFVSYCMNDPYYTPFLEQQIQQVYDRIDSIENTLWKQFLYPQGDPEYDIDYHPTI